MKKLRRSLTIYFLFSAVLLFAALPGHRRARPMSNSLPRPTALIRGGKLKQSAIRSTWTLPL